MPRTKKSAIAAAADLPIIETPVKTRKPRASRSKAAIAERAAAQEAADAQATVWLTDKLADEGFTMVAVGDGEFIVTQPVDAAPADRTPFGSHAYFVDDVHTPFMDDKLSMHAHRTDGHVMYANDLEAQKAGFLGHKEALADKATPPDFVTPSGIDFDAVMRRLTAVEHGFPEPAIATPAITAAGIDANLAALSTAVHPATDAEIDAAVAALETPVDDDPEVVRSLADVDFGAAYAGEDEAPEEAALARLERKQAARTASRAAFQANPYRMVHSRDFDEFFAPQCRPANVVQLPADEDTYTTLTSQYDRILELEGQLIDAKAEVQRADIVARAALRDVTEKKAIIGHQDAKIASLGIDLEGKQQACNLLAAELAGKSTEIRTLTSELTGARKNMTENYEVMQAIAIENGQFRDEIALLKIDLNGKATQVQRLTEEASKMIEESSKSNLPLASRGFFARLFNRAA